MILKAVVCGEQLITYPTVLIIAKTEDTKMVTAEVLLTSTVGVKNKREHKSNLLRFFRTFWVKWSMYKLSQNQ